MREEQTIGETAEGLIRSAHIGIMGAISSLRDGGHSEAEIRGIVGEALAGVAGRELSPPMFEAYIALLCRPPRPSLGVWLEGIAVAYRKIGRDLTALQVRSDEKSEYPGGLANLYDMGYGIGPAVHISAETYFTAGHLTAAEYIELIRISRGGRR